MGSKRVAEFTFWLALQRLGVQSCSATRFVIVKGVAKCTPQQSISRFPKWFCAWRTSPQVPRDVLGKLREERVPFPLVVNRSVEMQHRLDAPIFTIGEYSIGFNRVGDGEMVCNAPR